MEINSKRQSLHVIESGRSDARYLIFSQVKESEGMQPVKDARLDSSQPVVAQIEGLEGGQATKGAC